MILIISLLFSVLWLSSPKVVNVASGQGQITDVKVLEGDQWRKKIFLNRGATKILRAKCTENLSKCLQTTPILC